MDEQLQRTRRKLRANPGDLALEARLGAVEERIREVPPLPPDDILAKMVRAVQRFEDYLEPQTETLQRRYGFMANWPVANF